MPILLETQKVDGSVFWMLLGVGRFYKMGTKLKEREKRKKKKDFSALSTM